MKHIVTLVTGWRIDVLHERSYGMCYVEAPDGLKAYSIKRGFPLTDPTHIRCALFAVAMALEQVTCAKELTDKYFVNIVTKSKALESCLVGNRSESCRKWAFNPSSKPLKLLGYSKKFLADTFSMLDPLKKDFLVDIVYVPDDPESETSLLARRTVHLDVDPETDYAKTPINEDYDPATDTRTIETKQRYALKQELVCSGARGSRVRVKNTKKGRMAVAKSESVPESKTQEKSEKDTPPPPPKASSSRPRIEIPKVNTHKGLADALALEEARLKSINVK